MARQIVPQILVIVITFFQKIMDYFQHLRLQYILAVKVEKILLFADMSIKISRQAIFPEHVYHLVFVFVGQFSVQRKWIQILRNEQVDVRDKIFIIKILLVNPHVGNVR